MVRLLKFIFILLIILIALAIGAIFVLPKFLPQETIKKQISTILSQKTGKDIIISGNVGLSLFPDVKINIVQAEIKDPKNPKDVHYISDFDFKLDLLSYLISKDLKTSVEGSFDKIPLSLRVKLDNAANLTALKNTGLDLVIAKPINIKISGDVTADPNYVMIDNLSLAIEKTRANGKIEVKNLQTKPFLSGNLAFGILDVNELMKSFAPLYIKKEEPTPVTAPEAPKKGSDLWSKSTLDFRFLNAFDADVSATAESIKVTNIVVGNTNLKVTVDSGRMIANLAEMSLYGGKGAGVVTVYGNTAVPAVSEQYKLSGIEVGKLLHDATSFNRLDGKGSVEFYTTSKGNSVYDMVASLEGKGNVTLVDGTLKGVDLLGMSSANVDEILRGLNSQNNTDILGLNSTFEIHEGTLYNDDLLIQTPIASIKGRGAVSILNLTINYRVVPDVGAKYAGLRFPLNIKGYLEKPEITVDMQGVVMENLDRYGNKIEKKLDERLEKTIQKNEQLQKLNNQLQQNLGTDLQGTLKGFLGGGGQQQAPQQPTQQQPATQDQPQPQGQQTAPQQQPQQQGQPAQQ